MLMQLWSVRLTLFILDVMIELIFFRTICIHTNINNLNEYPLKLMNYIYIVIEALGVDLLIYANH